MPPLLSIIIPLYNKQNCILKTIDSVLSQDYDDYEIIVVDDGSTDDSVKVVERVSDQRIHLFRKENGGPSSARNYGIKKAQGKWVLFLDADDLLEECALKQVVSDIGKHRLADVFCYNLYMKQDTQNNIFVSHHKKGYLLFPFLYWYQGKIYPRTGNMVCKRSVMMAEPYREDYRRWEDGENTFRLMRKYRFYAIPIPLFTYCIDNVDASKPRENLSEDFCCNLQPKGKSLFEKLAQYKLYQEASWLYPDHIEQLYGDTFKSPLITRTIQLLELIKKMKRKVKKFIKRILFLG